MPNSPAPGESPKFAGAGTSRRSVLRVGSVIGMGAAASAIPGVRSAAAAEAASRGRVAVFGAGPGGMTVAHELAERGFQVDVYDKFARIGGGVRSFVTPGGGRNGRPSLPNTSGGHFFLPGYDCIPDMLRRIPVGDGRTVLDRLTLSSHGMTGLRLGLDGAKVGFGIPESPNRLTSLSILTLLDTVGSALQLPTFVTPLDAVLLASKLATWVTSGPQRRKLQLDKIETEYDFFRAERMSPGARALVKDLCQTVSVDSPTRGLSAGMWPVVLEQAINAYAGRKSYVPQGAAILLDGPETEVWFDPWARYLKGLGTRFHMRRTLTDVEVADGRITGATVKDSRGVSHAVKADWYVLAMPVDRLRRLLSPRIIKADPGLRTIHKLDTAVESGFELFFREQVGFEVGQITNRNVDERWLLTLVGLSEIWDLDLQEFGDGTARGMMSVEFNNHPWFDSPGMLYGKPIKDLTYAQAFEEIRAQIIDGLPGGAELFADGNFLGWRPHPTLAWRPGAGWAIPDLRTATAPDTAQYFPDPVRKIRNLFLVGGHTKAQASIDCMDTAAWSGKHAANVIVERAGVNEDLADLGYWDSPPELRLWREMDDDRFRRGQTNLLDIIAPARMP